MPVLERQWTEALDPIIHHWFEIGIQMRAPVAPLLFNVQGSVRSDEQIGGIGGVSVDAWDNYEKDGNVSEVDFNKGYIKTYTHKEYPLDMTIERKFMDDNMYPQITQPSMRLGISAMRKREVDAASVFNNAFSASYTGGDAVALCSASHPHSPDAAGTTQSNTGTTALSASAVASTRVSMMAFTDDKGNKLGITPDTILVPPGLEDTALVIAKSLNDPTSANNSINPQENRFNIVTWHYLTDANDWFMIDSVQMKQSLDWFNRVPLSINLKGGQDTTLKATWRAYMRYSFGFSDWRWIFGQHV
jgi:hypothetical protein